jgi:beta-1,4-mannosyl-glycoprotein beta-1,4-N-acetylglucosaminyltransferase
MTFKIIDCFIFYNELDLLTYRLNILNNVVDFFVIVESTHTHSGKEKKLFYNENKNLFTDFNHKIIHIIVDDFPYKYPNINFENKEQWINEQFQRNAISRGLESIHMSDDDLILISDLDEIPDPNTLQNIKAENNKVNAGSFEMDLYYYNLNTKFKIKWELSKIISYKTYKGMNIPCTKIRETFFPTIQNGGWHLSYFGDSNFIQNKIMNFGHQELNLDKFTDIAKIEERVKEYRDVFDVGSSHIDRIDIDKNSYLPPEYNKYLIKYYK